MRAVTVTLRPEQNNSDICVIALTAFFMSKAYTTTDVAYDVAHEYHPPMDGLKKKNWIKRIFQRKKKQTSCRLEEFKQQDELGVYRSRPVSPMIADDVVSVKNATGRSSGFSLGCGSSLGSERSSPVSWSEASQEEVALSKRMPRVALAQHKYDVHRETFHGAVVEKIEKTAEVSKFRRALVKCRLASPLSTY